MNNRWILYAFSICCLAQLSFIIYSVYQGESIRLKGRYVILPCEHIGMYNNNLTILLSPSYIETKDSIPYRKGSTIYLGYTCTNGDGCTYTGISTVEDAYAVHVKSKIVNIHPVYKEDGSIKSWAVYFQHPAAGTMLSDKLSDVYASVLNNPSSDSLRTYKAGLYMYNGQLALEDLYVNQTRLVLK